MTGSTSSYSRSIQIKNLARSQEKMNWRKGFPVPATTKGVLFSMDCQHHISGCRLGKHTFSKIAFVYQTRNNMRIFKVTRNCMSR